MTTTFLPFHQQHKNHVVALFIEVFSASENEQEGQLIGELVNDLIATTATEDLQGFMAYVEDTLIGCIFFSRLTLTNGITAFILSPVAIATSEQGKGVGQSLINHGLEQLTAQGISLALTYGDPNYYGKVGFEPITEQQIKAPLTLSFPHGWLAQSLDDTNLASIATQCQCVKALNEQKYW
ncbi:N-acetyltransferase [Thalassotalea sp. Y01]|uniref:GNAT family N-acetyltransferase n=1 Tax=Thalassotalea sp. Y01 TaxID=2729613 RepID=UPI00145E6B81|nr:N-acetyltransferase [Thalassotalea sp. Y01]NMP15457.1 N-acetyltransferase [Thalassotalea sp. Y01]